QTEGLRDEERSQLHAWQARRVEIRDDCGELVLARVQVEDELLLGETGHVAEERAAVTRVVDGAKEGRRRDRLRRRVRVQVAELDRRTSAEASPRLVHHLGGRVDSAIAEATSEQPLAEASVAAGKVEHLVSRLEPRPELDDEIGTMVEVGVRV